MRFKHVKPTNCKNDVAYFQFVDTETERLYAFSEDKGVWVYWPIRSGADKFKSSPPDIYFLFLAKKNGRILEKYVGPMGKLPSRFREVIEAECWGWKKEIKQ